MLRELMRRGPDAQHQMLWARDFANAQESVSNALVHARLSIIDPRPEADQPMRNEAGDIWISYNGEVYDWADDAAELVANGARFRTRSDTEFILKAYEQWGIDCVSRLRGMFAIAILDLRRGQLWLIRDRIGQKPIVYSHLDGDLAFGSTVRAVLPFLGKGQRRFSAAAIDAFLAHRYVPAPHTILENVRRLENGHWLRFDLKTRLIETFAYWSPHPTPGELPILLDQIVDMRTVADRPIGLFLSSGIDSSVIAGRLARLGRSDIEALTASFPGSPMDESEDARKTAIHLALRHSTVSIPERISGDFEQIVADLDEPFADPSSMPTWYLCRHATQRFKVALGGDGLDELMGGYKRVWKHLRTRWRRNWAAPWLPLLPSVSNKGWSKWSAECKMTWLESYSLRFSGFTPGQRLFLQPDTHGRPLTYWRLRNTNHQSPIAALLEADMDNYLPEYILRKSDLCSMAHGLELRAPFTDYRWVEAMYAIPENQRFTNPPKLIFEDMCPELRPLKIFGLKKRGFNPPLDQWIGNDLSRRFGGLGHRLENATHGQISSTAVDRYCKRFIGAINAPAEQLLQLVMLDESLAQLGAISE